MSRILIKNGRVLNPSTNYDAKTDILIEEGVIKCIGPCDCEPGPDCRVIDAEGMLVLPGLVDMHVHFREPGREDQETILGGAQVAARGGFTSVCTMPNTRPPIDSQALVRFIKLQAEKGPINIFPVASITKGLQGEEISEMGELLAGGAVAFTDDGKPVMNSLLMRRALEYSRMFGVPILAHEEDTHLADSGIINEGVNSVKLGLKGIPREAEEVMIARDVLLAKLTGGRLHVQHVSSGGSVEIIRRAKRDGVRVTCETAPHYFTLTDSAVMEKLSLAKMNPPLREEHDRLAIIEGLRDGTIDAIATDHAPHLQYEKMQELEYAPFGIVGLETAVALVVTVLCEQHGFSYNDAFRKLTVMPSQILGLGKGVLEEGLAADITVVNPDLQYTIDESMISSGCKNTPFIGMQVKGKVCYTICSGNIVHEV